MYKIKRIDLESKLSAEEALIQSALDNGWNVFLKSGQDKIELLTDSERKYLLNSATRLLVVRHPELPEVVLFEAVVNIRNLNKTWVKQIKGIEIKYELLPKN